MDSDLKNTILLAKMPKFIWYAEIYNTTNYGAKEKEAIGLILLDATEANQESINALIFAGYPDRCISLNENTFVTLQQPFLHYRYFSNLK